MSVYRALAATGPPSSPGLVEIALHLVITPFTKRGRGKNQARESIEAMLDRDYGMTKLGRCDYRLVIDGSSDSDATEIDEEMHDLHIEMINIAEGHRCSVEVDLREIGGQERSW